MMEPVAWLVKTRMGNIAWATWQPAGEPLVLLSDAEARIADLTRELAEARGALDEIANPVAAMQRAAKAEGNTLDGIMANFLANDVGYLRGIAARALKEKP